MLMLGLGSGRWAVCQKHALIVLEKIYSRGKRISPYNFKIQSSRHALLKLPSQVGSIKGKPEARDGNVDSGFRPTFLKSCGGAVCSDTNPFQNYRNKDTDTSKPFCVFYD